MSTLRISDTIYESHLEPVLTVGTDTYYKEVMDVAYTKEEGEQLKLKLAESIFNKAINFDSELVEVIAFSDKFRN